MMAIMNLRIQVPWQFWRVGPRLRLAGGLGWPQREVTLIRCVSGYSSCAPGTVLGTPCPPPRLVQRAGRRQCQWFSFKFRIHLKVQKSVRCSELKLGRQTWLAPLYFCASSETAFRNCIQWVFRNLKMVFGAKFRSWIRAGRELSQARQKGPWISLRFPSINQQAALIQVPSRSTDQMETGGGGFSKIDGVLIFPKKMT